MNSSRMPEEIEDEIEIETDPDEEEHHPIVDAEPHQYLM